MDFVQWFQGKRINPIDKINTAIDILELSRSDTEKSSLAHDFIYIGGKEFHDKYGFKGIIPLWDAILEKRGIKLSIRVVTGGKYVFNPNIQKEVEFHPNSYVKLYRDFFEWHGLDLPTVQSSCASFIQEQLWYWSKGVNNYAELYIQDSKELVGEMGAAFELDGLGLEIYRLSQQREATEAKN